jgi:hypothetical protein
MNKRFMALIVVLTLAVSGIANAAVLTGVLSSAENKATAYKQGEQEYWTGFTAQERLPKHGAYWVIVERNGGKWSLVDVSTRPIIGRDKDNQEVLYVADDMQFVQPYYENVPSTQVDLNARGNPNVGYSSSYNYASVGIDKKIERGTWECGFIMNKYKGYNPCVSALTKADALKSALKNVFALITTAGLASGTHRTVDKDAVAAVVRDTDLFNAIGAIQAEYEAKRKDINQDTNVGSVNSISAEQALQQKLTQYKTQ